MSESENLKSAAAAAARGEEELVEFHGDILEVIFCRVPLVHLLPASHVSKSWCRAVSSSLRHFNRPKPWLILHTQRSRPPYSISAHAYDPRSNLWLKIHHNSEINFVSDLRSAHSTLLYMLSPSKFSFSFDPLHLTWHHVDPPLVWRSDPIVAVVGHHVVVAGGAWDFEDDPLSVEIYNLETRAWNTCNSMPAVLRDSAASTWISVAVKGGEMFVMEKSSGVAFSFNPNSNIWSGPYDLCPDRTSYCSVIGFCGDRFIRVGLIGDPEEVTEVKLWEYAGEELGDRREIGGMPNSILEKIIGENAVLNSITMSAAGNFLFLHNSENPGEIAMCEISGDSVLRWGCVENAADSDESRMAERMVFTCSAVGMEDVRRAFGSKDRGFTVVDS